MKEKFKIVIESQFSDGCCISHRFLRKFIDNGRSSSIIDYAEELDDKLFNIYNEF
jgi:hypothetical protein